MSGRRAYRVLRRLITALPAAISSASLAPSPICVCGASRRSRVELGVAGVGAAGGQPRRELDRPHRALGSHRLRRRRALGGVARRASMASAARADRRLDHELAAAQLADPQLRVAVVAEQRPAADPTLGGLVERALQRAVDDPECAAGDIDAADGEHVEHLTRALTSRPRRRGSPRPARDGGRTATPRTRPRGSRACPAARRSTSRSPARRRAAGCTTAAAAPSRWPA